MASGWGEVCGGVWGIPGGLRRGQGTLQEIAMPRQPRKGPQERKGILADPSLCPEMPRKVSSI